MSYANLPQSPARQSEHVDRLEYSTGNPQDLTRQPIWRAEELGYPIPASTHAVSVALPRWQDVVGYEEKQPAVMSRLSSGYPRFVIHPLVQKLAQRITSARPALPFPSVEIARLCQQFIRRSSGEPAEVVERHGLAATRTSEKGEAALRAF